MQPLLVHGSDGCISALLPVFYLCPRGGGCGPVFSPLLEIEAGPDPSLVHQWWYDISCLLLQSFRRGRPVD